MRKPNSARDGTVGPHARWKRRKRALLAFDKLPIRFISSGTNDTNNAAAADLGWQRLLNLSSSSTSATLLSGRHHFPVAERTFRSRHPYRTSRTHVYIYESTFYTIYRYITPDYTPLATLTSKPIPVHPCTVTSSAVSVAILPSARHTRFLFQYTPLFWSAAVYTLRIQRSSYTTDAPVSVFSPAHITVHHQCTPTVTPFAVDSIVGSIKHASTIAFTLETRSESS